jgi:hypothetical protein
MLPTIFGFTLRETSPTPGQVIQWWTLAENPAGPELTCAYVRIVSPQFIVAGLRGDLLEGGYGHLSG